MIATKEKERAALGEIKKIVESLGEESYLSVAFDGCFEDAESNIENDFAYSMKSRFESAREEADYFSGVCKNKDTTISCQRDEINKLKLRIAELEAQVTHPAISHESIEQLTSLVETALKESQKKISAEALILAENADEPESEEFKASLAALKAHKQKLNNLRSLAKELEVIQHE